MSNDAFIIRMLVDQLVGRTVRARRLSRDDLGASAIEWAIISAVVVGLAIVVYRVVKGVIDSNADKIEDGKDF